MTLIVAGGMMSQLMVFSPPAMYECHPDQRYAVWGVRKLVEQFSVHSRIRART